MRKFLKFTFHLFLLLCGLFFALCGIAMLTDAIIPKYESFIVLIWGVLFGILAILGFAGKIKWKRGKKMRAIQPIATLEVVKEHKPVIINNSAPKDDEKNLQKSFIYKILHPWERFKRKKVAIDFYKNGYQNYILNKKENIDQLDDNPIVDKLSLTKDEIIKYKKSAWKSNVKWLFEKYSSMDSLSPENYSEFISLAQFLNVSPTYDQKHSQKIERLKLYWRFENEALAPINIDISLPSKEECYFSSFCIWKELRKESSVTYSGASASVKLAKGVRYRVGTYSPTRSSNDVLTNIDKGKIYITNNRILFTGVAGNKNIKINNILSSSLSYDGIQIQKDAGRSPVLACEDADIAQIIINRLINLK